MSNINLLMVRVSRMEDTEIIRGKVYLVKISRSESYGAQDELWAVCQQKRDLLTFQAFKNLVIKYNGRGFTAPKISEDRITWGEVKEKLEISRMEQHGSPVCHFDTVFSFRDMAFFAYDIKVLDDPSGREFLEKLKKGGTKGVEKRGGTGGTTSTFSEALKEVRDETENVCREESMGGVETDLGETALPGSVQGPPFVDQMDLTVNKVYNDRVFVTSAGTSGNQGAQLYEIIEIGDQVFEHAPEHVPEHAPEHVHEQAHEHVPEQVPEHASEQVTVGQGGKRKELEIYEVDGLMEEMEAESSEKTLEQWMKRAGTFQSISKTLRKKVKQYKESSEKFMMEADLRSKQMDEWKAYSAVEVVDGLKATLAPVAAIMGKLDKLQAGMADMETRLIERIDGVKTEVHELSEEMCSSSLSSKEDSRNVIRNLASNGLVERRDHVDIPSVMTEQLRLLRKVADPGTPVLDEVFFTGRKDATGRKGDIVSEQPGVVLDRDLKRGNNEILLCGPRSGDGLGAATATQQDRLDQVEIVPSIVTGHHMEPGMMDTGNDGKGLLPTPLKYRQTEINYQKTRKMSGVVSARREGGQLTPGQLRSGNVQVERQAPKKQVKFSNQRGGLSGATRSLFSEVTYQSFPPPRRVESQLNEQAVAAQQEIRRINALFQAGQPPSGPGKAAQKSPGNDQYLANSGHLPRQAPQATDLQDGGQNLNQWVQGPQILAHDQPSQVQGGHDSGYGLQPGVDQAQQGARNGDGGYGQHVGGGGQYDYRHQTGMENQQPGTQGQLPGGPGYNMELQGYHQPPPSQANPPVTGLQSVASQRQVAVQAFQTQQGQVVGQLYQAQLSQVVGQAYQTQHGQGGGQVYQPQQSQAGGHANIQAYQTQQNQVDGNEFFARSDQPPTKRKKSRWDMMYTE